MAGPPPKPFEIRLAEGNRSKGKIPVPENFVVASEKPLVKPRNLDEFGEIAWESVRAGNKCGIMGAESFATVGRYCRAYSRWCRMESRLDEEGFTVPGRSGQSKHPLLCEANTLLNILLRYEDSLGLTPSGRTRVRVDKPDKKATPGKSILGGPKAVINA